MNRAELKAAAKSQIKGKIGILLLITVIMGAITAVAGVILAFIPAGGLISTIIITPAFALSMIRVYLNVINNNTPVVADTFTGFNDFWAAFKVSFLVGLFTFLWSLLFVVPGIIKSYSYSMSMYVLAENKGKPALECIKASKEMTQGHKMELFVLQLSFIGWMLLSTITFGIALIWVAPYMNATMANAYQSLKPQAEPEAAVEEAVEAAAE